MAYRAAAAALLLLWGALAGAQSLTGAEAFFDDPALPEGTGTPISPLTPLDPAALAEAGLDVSGLAPGPHVLYLRFVDDAGEWSAPVGLPFLAPDAAAPAAAVTAAEAFFDDPAVPEGTGTPISPLTPLDPAALAEADLDVSGLAPGPHVLYLRFVDDAGEWSAPVGLPFLVTDSAALAVTASEFFIEDDPGLGLGETMRLDTVAGNPGAVFAEGRADLMAQAMNPAGGLIGTRLVNATGLFSPNLFQTVSVEDMDGDDVPDVIDAFPMDSSEWRDTDGDGIGNNSDPDIDGDGADNTVDADDDGDGMPDVFETEFGLDPRDPVDSFRDADDDGLTNLEEANLGTDPTSADTDGDGVPDAEDPTPGQAGILDEVPRPPGIDSGDALGAAVASAGNLFVAGAPDDEGGGAVYVFRIDGGEPVFEARITVPAGFVAEDFGASVALSGGTLVVGAPGEPAVPKGAGNLAALRAAIFERVGQGWTFKQPLNAGAAGNTRFGAAVAIEGRSLVVGAPEENGSGAAHVFELDGDSWTATHDLTPASPQLGQGFGAAVAVDRGKFAIASPRSLVGAAANGAVSLYDTIAGNLAETDTVTGSPGTVAFGASISLEGQLLAVGAPGENQGAGAVYSYGLQGQATLRNQFTPGDALPGDGFGSAVSVSQGRIAAGAPGSLGRGAIYTLNAAQLTQLQRYESTPEAETFGAAVAVSGDRIVIGAPDTRTTGAVALQRDIQSIFVSSFERN